MRALAQAHPQLWATVGVHPDYPQTDEPDVERLFALADHPRILAIGETGLSTTTALPAISSGSASASVSTSAPRGAAASP